MTIPAHGSVLLADDEAGILKTLGRALGEDGHELVATASAGRACGVAVFQIASTPCFICLRSAGVPAR